jgi:hypothetical protein
MAVRTPGLFIFLTAMLLIGCGPAHKYDLTDGYYMFREKGERYRKAYAFVSQDTVLVYAPGDMTTPLPVDPHKQLYFSKPSFDFDIMTAPFKYRPASQNLPRQLNADFNGNIFLGYRLDRFAARYIRTPFGTQLRKAHHAVTAGAFFGLGTTAVSPWTTNYHQQEEYYGVVVGRGFSVMFGVQSLTIGMAMGWDRLTDRDKDIWIYQNKPWYGVSFSLNLN